METPYDYQKFAILYVDDEEKSLKYFSRAFGDGFRILTATNARDGLRIIEEQGSGIGLLITDQRMPAENGVWLLERARQLYPHMIRILATAYSDMESAIAAVNSGAIYKYVTKPWDPEELEQTLKRSIEFFLVQRERDQLLREKMSTLHNLMIADRMVSLGLLAAGLSHHIRNSLVAVKTFLDLAPDKMAEEKASMDTLRNPEFWKDYHQNVQGQIGKINDLLKELWHASEQNTGAFNDEVDVHEAGATVLANLQLEFDSKGITVENAIPRDLPRLKLDRAKFHRLLDLLLRDELASLPGGCRVLLAASPAVGDLSRPEVEIQISDNGPGLSPQALRLLFDPFVLRADSPKELGINLMACFFIVHHHGGKIHAQSPPGSGTLFTIRLPLNPEAGPAQITDMDFLSRQVFNEGLWKSLASAP
jgi:two-component system probable response regulator PhcQ